MNKLKVLNDPVHGFINIPNELIFDILEDPFFQRLRRISQTGLTQLVYPGARHSRFHHALGAMHLMQNSLEVLKEKKIQITPEEEQGALLAILLHDVGHGPFSHSLETSIIENSHHENISLQIMNELNLKFNGELNVAIEIFTGKHPKKFLTQLVSSQLDVDRLDYLKRDSFFTGVVEGNINPQRIISMLNVFDNELVVDSKGIYSVEKFLVARMFMYWQVYLHKTSFSAELYLVEMLKRAKELVQQGENIFATTALKYFLGRTKDEVFGNEALGVFNLLDDSDITVSMKEWQGSSDKILSYLSQALVNRKLPKSKIVNQAWSLNKLTEYQQKAAEILNVSDGSYFVKQTKLSVTPYQNKNTPIKLLYKNHKVKNIEEADHQMMMGMLQNTQEKYHVCYLV